MYSKQVLQFIYPTGGSSRKFDENTPTILHIEQSVKGSGIARTVGGSMTIIAGVVAILGIILALFSLGTGHYGGGRYGGGLYGGGRYSGGRYGGNLPKGGHYGGSILPYNQYIFICT